jgi:putative endonuclease
MQSQKQLGNAGERIAAQYLESLHYTMIDCNFAVHDVGEIDLIARHDMYLICVEVKTRVSLAVPFSYLVPWSKQRKIIRTAQYYVQRHALHTLVVRFDVIFVDMSAGEPVITHIQNAFMR